MKDTRVKIARVRRELCRVHIALSGRACEVFTADIGGDGGGAAAAASFLEQFN